MSNWESALALLASSTQTASGASAAIDLGARDRLLRQTLAVTAATGSLSVHLEASADGVAAWRTFGAFTAISVVTNERLTFIAPERYVRVVWAVAGSSPSFTFAIAIGGTKGVAYANLEHFERFGLQAAAWGTRTPTHRAEALASASVKADGKLALRYDLPLVSWDIDLAEAVAKVAAYDELSMRGFNPDGGDDNVRKRHDDAVKWLTDVANSHINPLGIVDTTPDVDDDGPIFSGFPTRTWV